MYLDECIANQRRGVKNMRAITRLALVVAIAILYVPISVLALVFYPFFKEEK